MKLQEIFALIDAQTVTTTGYIKQEFNKFTAMGVAEMTDNEASGIYYVLKQRLSKLLKCNTIYGEGQEDKAVDTVKTILAQNIINLTVEIRNMMKAISKDLATNHAQTKFNPVDNDNIDNAPISMDNTSLSYGQNYITQAQYFADNSVTLGYIYNEFANICYLIGKGSNITKTLDPEYATKKELNTEIARAEAAEATLEAYCDSLDATKADVDSIGKYITVTAMSGTLTDEQLEALQDNDKNYIIYSNNGNSTIFKATRTTSTTLIYSATISNTIYTLTITVATKAYAITSEDTEDFATKTELETETTARTNADTQLQTNIDAKSTVAVSSTGSATDEVNYITVNGTEYKLPSGSSTTNHLYRHSLYFLTSSSSIKGCAVIYNNDNTHFNVVTLNDFLGTNGILVCSGWYVTESQNIWGMCNNTTELVSSIDFYYENTYVTVAASPTKLTLTDTVTQLF